MVAFGRHSSKPVRSTELAAIDFLIPGLLGMNLMSGSVVFAGMGLLVASRARTIEGVSGLMNLLMLPLWIFSGIFFSTSRFPEFMQPFIQGLPLTPLIDGLRAVMLDGASLAAVSGEIAIAGAWGVGSFTAALLLFRWS